ncbi:hypothetical protein Zm00014a_037827, partial [Zea mays]
SALSLVRARLGSPARLERLGSN